MTSEITRTALAAMTTSDFYTELISINFNQNLKAKIWIDKIEGNNFILYSENNIDELTTDLENVKYFFLHQILNHSKETGVDASGEPIFERTYPTITIHKQENTSHLYLFLSKTVGLKSDMSLDNQYIHIKDAKTVYSIKESDKAFELTFHPQID